MMGVLTLCALSKVAPATAHQIHVENYAYQSAYSLLAQHALPLDIPGYAVAACGPCEEGCKCSSVVFLPIFNAATMVIVKETESHVAKDASSCHSRL